MNKNENSSEKVNANQNRAVPMASDTDAAGYPTFRPDTAQDILDELSEFEFSTFEQKHGCASALKELCKLKRRARRFLTAFSQEVA